MRRITPAIAAAMAAALAASTPGSAPNAVRVVSAQKAGTLPKLAGSFVGHSAGSLLAAILGSGARFRIARPTYRNRNGLSVAAGQRAARKRRNVLRARGHHRKAVR